MSEFREMRDGKNPQRVTQFISVKKLRDESHNVVPGINLLKNNLKEGFTFLNPKKPGASFHFRMNLEFTKRFPYPTSAVFVCVYICHKLSN